MEPFPIPEGKFVLKPLEGLDPDTTDQYQFLEANEMLFRERIVASERMRLLRLQLRECYRIQGVNHFEKCQLVRETFARLLMDRYYGQALPASYDPRNRANPTFILPESKKHFYLRPLPDKSEFAFENDK